MTVEDFHKSEWNDALQSGLADSIGYIGISTALSKSARTATEDGYAARAKVLWLLADVTSMTLTPNSIDSPFKPFAVFPDSRSAMPEDFSPEDLVFFSQIVDLVSDAMLKARLADLLWLVAKPRNVQFALKAIDAYQRVPLTPGVWIKDGQECWTRALVLAQSLRKGAGSRVDDLQKKALEALMQVGIRDKFFGVRLARLLRSNRLAKDHGLDVAHKIESFAKELETHRDFFGARACYEEAAHWFNWLKQQDKHAEMTAAQAETYVVEAGDQASEFAPSRMVANSCYEKAIQIYREIPGKLRAMYKADARIEELRRQQSSTAKQVLDEMRTLRSPTISISQLVDQARAEVSGKEAVEALRLLANIYQTESVDALRASAIKRMTDFPLLGIFERTTYSQDGRVIVRRPAMNSMGRNSSENNERVIQTEMIRDYCLTFSLAVQSAILPALEVLRQEHRLTEDDFVGLSQDSPIVPIGRAPLFGKALYAGYGGDFVAAIHLLVPQIEHMVRVHLKQASVATTTLDKEGIETENGLSTLMTLPEAVLVFGSDVAFELKALLCDSSGPNLRNELAHGLLDDASCRTAPSIYAWWLGLRLVFNTWWNTRAAQQAASHAGS